MLALLSTLLLIGIAVFVSGAMVATWQQYGPAALALRGQLRTTVEFRSFTWTAQELIVRRGPAAVRQLPLKAPRAVLHSGLRAAA